MLNPPALYRTDQTTCSTWQGPLHNTRGPAGPLRAYSSRAADSDVAWKVAGWRRQVAQRRRQQQQRRRRRRRRQAAQRRRRQQRASGPQRRKRARPRESLVSPASSAPSAHAADGRTQQQARVLESLQAGRYIVSRPRLQAHRILHVDEAAESAVLDTAARLVDEAAVEARESGRGA